MQLSAKGPELATATSDFISLSLWDLDRAGKPMDTSGIRMDANHVIALQFGEEAASLVELDIEGHLRRWSPKAAKVEDLGTLPVSAPEPPFQEYTDVFLSAAFFDAGRGAAVVGGLGGLQVLDLQARTVVYRRPGISRFAMSSDESTLAMARNSEKLEYRRNGRGLDGDAWNTIVKQWTGGTIVIADRKSGEERITIEVPGSEVWAMAFAPDGKTLAATSGWESGRMHLYDVASGKETRTFDGPPFRSPALAFTPDGSRIVSGMADRSILVWDVVNVAGR